MTDWRETLGGILFLGSIAAAVLLAIVHVSYGWGAFAVFAAFCAGLMLIFSD